MRILKIAVFASLALSAAAPAYALDRLSDRNIQKFYDEAADAQRKGKERAVKFIQDHFSEDVVVNITTIIKIPGAAENQEDVQSFNKAQMLETTAKGFDAGTVESFESKIMAANITDDERTADVKTTNYTVMRMSAPTPDGQIEVRSETTMFCSDTLGYSKKGEIEVTKSDCTAEAKITPLQ